MNAMDDIDRTLLLAATKQGNKAIVKLLLEKGADVDVNNKNSWTPFFGTLGRGTRLSLRCYLRRGPMRM